MIFTGLFGTNDEHQSTLEEQIFALVIKKFIDSFMKALEWAIQYKKEPAKLIQLLRK